MLGRDSTVNVQGFQTREEATMLADQIDEYVHCIWSVFVGTAMKVRGAIRHDVQVIYKFSHSMGVLAEQLPVGWPQVSTKILVQSVIQNGSSVHLKGRLTMIVVLRDSLSRSDESESFTVGNVSGIRISDGKHQANGTKDLTLNHTTFIA